MLDSITNHPSWQPDNRFGDTLMIPKRWCDKQWDWFKQKTDEKDCKSGCYWTELAKRIVAFIPLVLATLVAYSAGLLGIVFKSFSENKDQKTDVKIQVESIDTNKK